MTKPTSYELLKDVYDAVNRLEAKLDKRITDLEHRVDILEDFKGKVIGVATVIGAFVGAITSWIWEKITRY